MQRAVAEALAHFVVRDRAPCLPATTAIDVRLHRMAADRRIDAAARAMSPLREREVFPAHAARLQLAHQSRSARSSVLATTSSPLGVLVEAMDDAGARQRREAAARGAAARWQAFRPSCRCPGGRPVPAGLSITMSASSSCTIARRRLRRKGTTRGSASGATAMPLAAGDASAWARSRRAGERDAAGIDPGLEAAARMLRQQLRERRGRAACPRIVRRDGQHLGEARPAARSRALSCIIRSHGRAGQWCRKFAECAIRAADRFGRDRLRLVARSQGGNLPAGRPAVRRRRTGAMLSRQLYARGQKLFDTLEGRLSVRPVRAAGDRSRAPTPISGRARQPLAIARLRSLHPHLSQSPERRLRLLSQGPDQFPRRPGCVRLRRRAGPVRARSEDDQEVIRRRSAGIATQISGEQVCARRDRAYALSHQCARRIRSPRRATTC